MSMLFDLSEELEVWAKEYGDETISKMDGLYYRIDYKRGKRKLLFVILLEKLKALGAEKGYFSAGPVRNAIIEFCLPPKHVMGSRKYANATMCVVKDLRSAIIEVYGSESDYYKNNGKTRDIIVTEKSELEKQAEQEHAKPIEEPAKLSVRVNNVPIKEFEPLPEEVPPEPKARAWKDVKEELIASGKLVDDKFVYETDPEIDALFGIKKDE